MDLKSAIRTIPDHPKPGIMFRDVTTLFAQPAALAQAVQELAAPYRNMQIDHVVGIEARGFILGGALAIELGAGFVPLRKPGKLPANTLSQSYELEYGTDELHIHADAIRPGQRVLLTDDLIATGGTALAAVSLLKRVEAELVGACFIIDLPDLGGADKLRAIGCKLLNLLEFEGD